MKKIVSISGSSSRNSINKKLAEYSAGQVPETIVINLDLNDYEMPIYSIDRENVQIPDLAFQFREVIKNCDGVVVSLAEHNGSYSAAFKNLLDWVSRAGKGMWQDKPLFLLSTSPGGRGGLSVFNTALGSFPRFGGNIVASMSLPNFGDNFSSEEGITDAEIQLKFEVELSKFIAAI